MFESIKSFFDIIFDTSKSIGHRSAVLLSTIGFLMIVELVFNFTYDIYISNKLTNLKTINELKDIYKNDSVELERLNRVEKRVLNRWHYSEYLPFYNYSNNSNIIERVEIKTTQTIQNKPIILSKEDSLKMEKMLILSDYKIKDKNFKEYFHFFDSLRNSQQKVTEKIEVKTTKQPNKRIAANERSKLWMFLSANFLFILIALIMFIASFFTKEQKKGNLIVGIFAFEVILAFIMLLVYWSAYLIPIILNNPLYNYLLNAFIHLIIVIIGIRLIIKASKK